MLLNEEQLNFEALPDGKYLVKYLTEKDSYNKFILAILEITYGEHKDKRQPTELKILRQKR